MLFRKIFAIAFCLVGVSVAANANWYGRVSSLGSDQNGNEIYVDLKGMTSDPAGKIPVQTNCGGHVNFIIRPANRDHAILGLLMAAKSQGNQVAITTTSTSCDAANPWFVGSFGYMAVLE